MDLLFNKQPIIIEAITHLKHVKYILNKLNNCNYLYCVT